MNKLLTLAFLFSTLFASAQITITTADLPHANDIEVLSTATAFSGMDATLTGPNYTWDYSQLSRIVNQIDSFYPESAGNPLLTIYFINSGFNSNRSNLATSGTNFSLGAQITLSNVFNYYYNSTSSYQQTGIGAEVNGVPLPITFSPHDRIYSLPMTYNQQDSVHFGYGIDLSTTIGIYYAVNKFRKNQVDGWGTVITPYASYPCLRVKTTIIETDSIHIDTLGFGFNTPPITTYEYKWLATGEKVPVLQINATGAGTVSSILFKDSLNTTSVNTLQAELFKPEIFPNPAHENLSIRFQNTSTKDVILNLYTLDGKLLLDKTYSNIPSGLQTLSLDISSIPTGNYLLKVGAGVEKFVGGVRVE